jgi:hypothetical protein
VEEERERHQHAVVERKGPELLAEVVLAPVYAWLGLGAEEADGLVRSQHSLVEAVVVMLQAGPPYMVYCRMRNRLQQALSAHLGKGL